jgi:RimJ/RimL family protein N-acetyltransferase
MVLRQVNRALFAQRELGNIGELEFWVNKNWSTEENFLKWGFGFCLVHEKRIVSWSLADCVVGTRCEIGIETDEAYRRRGLATTVVVATVAHALQQGMCEIGWHCWEHNIASRGVAEKAEKPALSIRRLIPRMFPISTH